jgi:hypothetical protein
MRTSGNFRNAIAIAAVLQFAAGAAAGQTDSVPRYVDFHIHTILKNYYRNIRTPGDVQAVPANDNSNWKVYHSRKDPRKFNNLKSPDQATYSLLGPSHASILCTSLYTLEKQSLTDQGLPVTGLIKKNWLRKFVQHSFFSPVDRLFSMRWINKLFVTGVGQNRQKTAYARTSNFEELTAQLAYIKRQAVRYRGYKPVCLAGPHADLNDTSKVWLVLSVEGAHNFYGYELADPSFVPGYSMTYEAERQLLKNLDSVKNNFRLFFVTPSHLFENKIAGGARGLDIDNSSFRKILSTLMWDPRFSIIDNKAIEGVNQFYYFNTDTTSRIDVCHCNHDPPTPEDTVPFGWDFIRRALDTNAYGKRTYIDLRHMDVLAREQVIDSICYWDTTCFKDNPVPLIISHTAASGKNRQMAAFLGQCPMFDNYLEFIPGEIRNFYFDESNKGHPCLDMTPQEIDNFLDNKGGWFHPMSNNLFDEEIQAVYRTHGILGITLEERALGWNAYNYSVNPKTIGMLGNFLDSLYTARGKPLDSCLRDSLLKGEPFVRNLFYIVETSNVKGPEAWEHIALGSDFDGIMNPIDICTNAADIPNFHRFLCEHLPDYAAYLRKPDLLYKQTPRQLMDQVFYKNGERFIKKYF